MTLRCVPVEYLRTLMDSVRRFGSLANNEEIIGDNHAPPPPADIAEALELANAIEATDAATGKGSVVHLQSERILAYALRKSWGRE